MWEVMVRPKYLFVCVCVFGEKGVGVEGCCLEWKLLSGLGEMGG
jgi:hypothetical protein